ncbi:EpsG family protein [Pseudomonas saliphila]|uniref:EpsG family protein n=1 Tax=Pseudomonas saliphila TaxID=2586906 RepID=UPI00123C3C44|nr:EpsG family protein [Pseudomonas saliphila]
MTIYTVLVVAVCFFCSLAWVDSRQVSRLSLIVGTVILIIFTALRFESGADYDSYVEIFLASPSVSELSLSALRQVPAEVGYVLLNSLFKSVSSEAFLFLALLSCLSIASKSFVIYKMSDIPYLSFVLYFAFVYFNSEYIQVRWAFALSLIYVALYLYVSRRSTFGAVIALCAAVSMHVFSLYFVFAFIAYIAVSDRFSVPVFFWFGLGCLATSFLLNISETMLVLVSTVGFDGYFYQKLVGYLRSVGDAVAWHVTLRYVLIYFLVCYFARNFSDSGSEGLYKFYCYIFGVVMLLSSFPIALSRGYIFCELLSALLIANGVARIKCSYTKMVWMILILLVCLIYWLLLGQAFVRNDHIYEYNTWLRLIG